jgi:hypothetical protein
MLEIHLKGPGTTTVGLFDKQSNLLLIKRLVLSGPKTIEAKSRVPLSLNTRSGEILIAPVLIHQTDRKQLVTFAGQDPESATEQRFKEMKLSEASAAKVRETAARAALQNTARVLSLDTMGKRPARRR